MLGMFFLSTRSNRPSRSAVSSVPAGEPCRSFGLLATKQCGRLFEIRVSRVTAARRRRDCKVSVP